MSGEKKEANTGTFLGGVVLGFTVGLLASAYLVFTSDSRQIELEACDAKLERDRYCVMIAVPSEYKLTLPKGESNGKG